MIESQALFTFGTLMDAELLELVCEQDPGSLTMEPALVTDQARRWVLDDHYPVLVPVPGAQTLGLIIRGLQEEAMRRIVFFEGEEFSIQPLEVRLACGKRQQVQYFADNKRKPHSDSEWLLEQWQRTTKPDTMPRVRRYMQCYGKMSMAEADAYW